MSDIEVSKNVRFEEADDEDKSITAKEEVVVEAGEEAEEESITTEKEVEEEDESITAEAESLPLPINWPADIEYLRQPQISPSINPVALKLVNKPTAAAVNQARFALDSIPFPNPRVRITQLHDPLHPANHQYGLFAVRPYAPGTFILPYVGRIHNNTPDDTDASSSYDITLDRELGLAIDAGKAGNEARFVNDYRHIKDKPNAEFRDCWIQVAPAKWERWIGVFVLSVGKAGLRKSGIKAGQEILVSYGKSFWKERNLDRS